MLQELLKKRAIPPLPAVSSLEEWESVRKQMLETLCREEYGFPVPDPVSLTAEVVFQDSHLLAERAVHQRILLTARLPQGEFSFPVEAVIPRREEPVPAFICLSFFDHIPNFSLPCEEISDAGFAMYSLHYTDITSDNNDFTNGLAGLLGPREEHSPGKLAMWAWGAMRVMDYLQGLSFIDHQHIAVAGHSRLGKTALLTSALDTRFALAVSNESGNSGAALSRGKSGESIANITSSFPFWFAPHYQNYVEKEASLPFDQHFLLALTAPRKLYVCSAQDDAWSDPTSEFLGCAAASAAWENLGLPGFRSADRLPEPGSSFHEGNIGYHIRTGAHALIREDWQNFMIFFRQHF